MFHLMLHVAAASFLSMAWFVQSSVIRISTIWFQIPKPRKHVFKLCYRFQLCWPIGSCMVIEHSLCNTVIKLGPCIGWILIIKIRRSWYRLIFIMGILQRLDGIFHDSKVHRANMGPTWALSSPSGPHVGPMNLAIWVILRSPPYL